ncbi:MAG: hypothetical protein WDW38_005582 [Sanguina aurantia]
MSETDGGTFQPTPPPSPGPVAVPKLSAWQWLKKAAKALKREVLALYYATQDPRTSLLAKILPIIVLAYALSPIDLVPDFIPVLGILDDLILLPGLIWLAIYLIPHQVMADARERADTEPLRLASNWLVATLIFLMWVGSAEALAYYLARAYGSENANVQLYLYPGMGAAGLLSLLAFAGFVVMTVRADRARSATAAVDPLSACEEGAGVGGEGEEQRVPLLAGGQGE